MATTINYNAFYSDYSAIAACLQSINQAEQDGFLSDYADILAMLRQLENDLLKKLYIQSIYTLAEVDQVETIENGIPDDYFYGDFAEDDFIYDDFYVGYLDTSSSHYNAIFQSILNIFAEIIGQEVTLNQARLDQLNADLIAFLEAFWAIQRELAARGLDLCGTGQQSSPYNNSPGVYLQAVGSDGQQGIVEGIHLRWSFTDELAYYHLPKGDYFNGSSDPLIAYNRPDDYVRVYRTPYQPGTPLQLDLSACIPAVNHLQQSWVYTINTVDGDNQRTAYIKLIFEDRAAYDLLARLINLASGPSGRFRTFINSYPGLLRIEVLGATCFRVNIQVSNPALQSQMLKIEAISGMDVTVDYDKDNDFVSYRSQEIPAADSEDVLLTGENIKYIRLKKTALLELDTLVLDTYGTLLEAIAPEDWDEIGTGFALSLDNAAVYDRLENTAKPIDDLWPHFHPGTRVRASNYRDKWLQGTPDDPSIRTLVNNYLTLSVTDPRAEEFFKAAISVTGDEEEGITVSNLDMVNLVSMDYHFARMLGLGYIDPDLPQPSGSYIYQLRYTNKKSMGSSEVITYSYTSLPTGITDKRLPQKPATRPLTYTFPDPESPVNTMLDENGYSKLDALRVVNIGRQQESREQEGFRFFADMHTVVNANIFTSAKPVNYGIAYRKSTDTSYIKPEITTAMDLGGQPYYAYDDDFPQGILEPVPVEDNPESLYIHFVRENGIHHYAIYAIDWFFRASAISDEVMTDETVIPLAVRLEPPTNIGVQYIQPEDPVLLTTGAEQSWIAGRQQQFPGQDIGLTRVTFDWKDIVDVSEVDTGSPAELADVPRADQADAFFLPRMPIEVTGRIVKVTAVSGNDKLMRIHTGPQRLIDGSLVAPTLDASDYSRFVDSILTVDQETYRVHTIENGQQGPDIIVEKRLVEELISDEAVPADKGVFREWIAPDAGNRFTMTENLGDTANWSPLASTVALHSFADPQDPEIETVVDLEGNARHFWIGGITEQAGVAPLWGGSIPSEEGMPGFYRVTFDDYTLAPHPQSNIPYEESDPDANAPGTLRTPHVEWYKGIIRMPLSADPSAEMKEVEVLRIESFDPLTLYIMDPDYATTPIYVPAPPQESVKVNFHPGYRAYYFTEPAPGLFNKNYIEPTAADNDRRTLLALQSRDTSISGGTSDISIPTVLLALYIQEPQPIEMPTVTVTRVRPDATKLAAFTFDIQVDPGPGGQQRNPFGFMFYRTDHEEILAALYAPATIVQILEDLATRTNDIYYDQRYEQLANLEFDPDNPGHFKVYPPEDPEGYGFPVPDKENLVLPSDPLPIKIEKYRRAIESTLMPLTEQPPIFAYIKEGYTTENAIPVIRDMDGKLLDVADSRFNPFPMVRKFKHTGQSNTWYVRFTDYHLSGNSRLLYFYAAVEITNKLQPGELSPFAGPIAVLQTLAGEAPQVKAYEIEADTNFDTVPAMVHFQLAPFSIDDRISKVRIYRFDTSADTVSTANSSAQVDHALGEFNPEGYTVTDAFMDLEEFPYYGKNIYYRLAGIRTILNEDGLEEEVLSLLSDVIAIPIADSKHPVSPVLVYEDSPAPRLVWQPVGQDYIYRLYKQNATGNWNNVREVLPPQTNQQMDFPVGSLPEYDEDGDRIYHRFKISVESTLGQFNLLENEIVI